MPNQEIDDFTEDTTPADGDLIPTVDVSDTTDSPQGTTKKVQAQNLVVKKIREAAGPTVLTVGAVADGEFLKRSGSTIISGAAGGGGGAFEDFDEGAAPATPAAAKVRLYAKADGLLYSKDDAGLETVVTGGGGGGTPGGATTQIQFNDAGAFGGDAGLVWDKTNDILTLSSAGKVRSGAGLASAPSLSFQTNTDTGLWTDNDNMLVAVNGTAVMGIRNNSGTSVQVLGQLGLVSSLMQSNVSAGFALQAVGQLKVIREGTTNAGTIFCPTRTMATPAGVPTPDLTQGNVQRHTLIGNVTFGAPASMVDGIELTIICVQDATGSRTAAWNAVYKWAGGVAPTLTTAANSVDIFRFWCNGTNVYEIGRFLDVR